MVKALTPRFVLSFVNKIYSTQPSHFMAGNPGVDCFMTTGALWWKKIKLLCKHFGQSEANRLVAPVAVISWRLQIEA